MMGQLHSSAQVRITLLVCDCVRFSILIVFMRGKGEGEEGLRGKTVVSIYRAAQNEYILVFFSTR
jgi:hypothetical protein